MTPINRHVAGPGGPHPVSRRAAIAGAAWTAPTIVAVTAAPAHATSHGGTGHLDYSRGGSEYRYHADPDISYVFFKDHTLVCRGGPGIDVGGLTVSPTCSEAAAHSSTRDPGAYWAQVGDHPNGQGTYTYQYQRAVATGGSVDLPQSNIWSAASGSTATFAVSFNAPGYNSAVDVFAPPAAG
ncbi:hypothetical protein [Nocardioides sp.]|uniref:hypothetical protein n=1 Tax=Nocardioides sp. TaxID=35761 RepID=UPI002B26A183|nr:hypothetical protein [Nocardioides sp.]